MSKLKERFFEKSSSLKVEVKSKLKEHGGKVVGEVTLAQVFGGMRGVPSLVWETSKLDSVDGIKFRGLSIPELRDQLPSREGCSEPLPEGLFWLMLVGEIPTKEEVDWLSAEWMKRSTVPCAHL